MGAASKWVQALIVALSFVAVESAVLADSASPGFAEMLPPGVVYPQASRPTAPILGGDVVEARNPLAVETKDCAVHRLNLDPTANCGAWAGRLLLLEIGMPQPWSPDVNYAIYPEGLQGQGNYLIVWLARQMPPAPV